MAIEVPDKYQNVNRRASPPKKEKLFRKRPIALVGFVEKKPVNVPLKKKLFRKESMAMIEYVGKKQVECDKKKKMSNSVKLKRQSYSGCEYSIAMDRARAIQAGLGTEFPSFVKYMLPSHVTGGFWLGLPTQLCRSQLAKEDTMMMLEDDDGKEYETKYLSGKRGLSGGWRGYSIAHNLVEGDVLVFHLVTPSKFKIYTVRADGSDEVGGVLGLLKLDTCTKRMDSKEAHCLDHLLQAITQEESAQNDIPMHEASPDLEPTSESDRFENENEAEDLCAETRLVQSDINFQAVKSIDSFNITVNGVVINSEFPKHILTKYYDLCRSQQSYLHVHLLDGIFLDVVIGAITEITNIADGIRASHTKTPQKELVIWDTTLKAFEIFGMNVSFLHARIDRLMGLLDKSNHCSEAKSERIRAREELRNLVLHVEELILKLDGEIESLDMDPEKLKHVFHDVANGPWG